MTCCFASNVGETEADKLGLRAKVERLTAEVENRDFVISHEIASQAPDVARGETELYNSRREQFHNEISGLEEQLVQKKQELRDFESKEDQFKHSLGLIRQEIKMSEPLLASGAISKVELLRLRRTEVETAGQLNSISLSLPKATSEIKEIENKIGESRGRFQSDALAQLNEARTNLSKTQASVKHWRSGEPYHGHLTGAGYRPAGDGEYYRRRHSTGQRSGGNRSAG